VKRTPAENLQSRDRWLRFRVRTGLYFCVIGYFRLMTRRRVNSKMFGCYFAPFGGHAW
jgi:hypothetical protein